ncbi:MAG: hypothetical protein JNM64_07470 [Chloroflexia bacterium]|nr:hypothetical protein [Chloroflexia bacterium]
MQTEQHEKNDPAAVSLNLGQGRGGGVLFAHSRMMPDPADLAPIVEISNRRVRKLEHWLLRGHRPFASISDITFNNQFIKESGTPVAVMKPRNSPIRSNAVRPDSHREWKGPDKAGGWKLFPVPNSGIGCGKYPKITVGDKK